MNCQSLNITLQYYNYTYDSELWGLSYPYNNRYCSWSNLLKRLVTFNDFEQNLENPLYQVQLMQQNVDGVFFPVCYAYCLLRIFILIVICYYVRDKLVEMKGLSNTKLDLDQQQQQSIKSYQQSIQDSSRILVENHKIESQINFKQAIPIKFTKQKQIEITVYRLIIYFSITIELVCALRDFILFRGLLLYSNIMDDNPKTCYIFFTGDQSHNYNFTCNKGETNDFYTEFQYNRNYCNCLYNTPESYLSDEYGGYMTFSIILWIITEALSISVRSFTIITLSRINRNEKSGWSYLNSILFKSLVIFGCCSILFTIMIYFLQYKLYYRFYTQNVILYYFFWKFLGFILVFDRLYSKIWMEMKLRFQSLHSHGIDWNEHLVILKRKLMKNFDEKIITKNQNQNEDKKIDKYIEKNLIKIKKLYLTELNQYYSHSIQPYLDRYHNDSNAKLKTKWYDYLNYILIVNLIGLVGFFFLIVYSFSTDHMTLFWIGFFLAFIELLVFEISNVFFILHSFFIELFNNIKLVEQQKQRDEYSLKLENLN